MTFADGGNIVDLMDGRLLGMHSKCESVWDIKSVRELSSVLLGRGEGDFWGYLGQDVGRISLNA